MSQEAITTTRLAIKDSLKKLEDCASLLRSRLSDVKSSGEGVKSSTATAREEVEQKFAAMQDEIIKALTAKQRAILSIISEVERKDLEPLRNLEEKINGDLEKVSKLIEQGSSSLDMDDENLLAEAEKIKLELQPPPAKYPDVPCVSQTLSITFDESQRKSLIDAVNVIGEVSMTGSLQIVDLSEQPGGMLVQWDDESQFSDSESFTDFSGVQEYMLQVCRTDNRGNKDSVFNTVYEGEDLSFLVTDLEPNLSYTFRVCSRFGNEGRWSSWSIPRNGITSLDPHEWSVEDCVNENRLPIYQLSNRRKTATKVFPDCSKVLKSKTMSYRLGTSLTFKIDETGDPSNGDGIGLTTALFDFKNTRQILQCPGAVSLNSKGLIFVNGTCMTTRLPQFKKGTAITFEANKLAEKKLRVSITVDDKQVTFDWYVQSDEDRKLYFAMGFQQSGWQVTV